MSIFDIDWIVEIEYSDGFFRSTKRDSIIVKAKNDYEAKLKVKNDPNYHHEYFRVRSVKRFEPQKEQASQIDISDSKPLTEEERKELEIRMLKYEEKLKESKRQEKIANQQAKINSINKSPTTAGIVSTVISIFAFLFAWIPYWYFDARRAAAKSTLDELFKLGHTMEEPIMQEMYLNGLHAKEARNSVIWIPFVILVIGIVVTIVVINHYKKTKHSKLALAKKELEQIEKESLK